METTHHHHPTTTEHIHPPDPTDDPHSGHTTGHPPGHDSSMPGMRMYFHAGVNEIILIKSWETHSVGEFIGAVFAIFFLGFLYEGIKFGREYLFQKYVQKKCQCAPQHGSGENSHASGSNNSLIRSYSTKMLSWLHFLQSFFHMIQFIVAYLLMLIFMTYNIWLCLAVTLGSLCGYFVFGWKKTVTVDLTEHCH